MCPHTHTYITHKFIHIHAYTHTCIHAYTHTHIHTYTQQRLSPEFHDCIIRLPILISSGVLMMIGVLPMHPSPYVSFVRWRLVGGIGGWIVWLISCLNEVGWLCIW